MRLRFEVELSVRMLSGTWGEAGPRRSVYAKLTLGKRTWWIQRWHRLGQPKGLRDWRANMTWNCGLHTVLGHGTQGGGAMKRVAFWGVVLGMLLSVGWAFS